MTWKSRPDLNWCPYCHFAGKFEAKDREIGSLILCLNCGSTFSENDPSGRPRFFSDDEWDKYWVQNIKSES